MFIEFAVGKNSTSKQKGDLLENLAKKVLENQFYKVEKEIRRTGMELDLLCIHKSNPNKKIYVECKAYNKDNSIQSDVIKQLVGTINIEDDISEGWLIATGKLGKDAKGLRDKIINQQNKNNIVIYTIDEIIELLVNSNVIFNYRLIESKLKEYNIINNKNININIIGLLITEINYFYVVIVEENLNSKGVILFYAKDKDIKIVKEIELLKQIKELESFISKKNLDIFYIKKFFKIEEDFLSLNNHYLNKINSLDINVQHPLKRELMLDDIFVYPDLDVLNKSEKKFMNSEEIYNYDKCLIFGDDISGKTSLAYMLQKDLNEKDNISIYVNAKEIKNVKKDKFVNLLYRKFQKQYYELEKNEFYKIMEDKKENFILIIDDFQDISIRRDSDKIKFIKGVNDNFQKIYIFANSKIELEIMNMPEYKNEVFLEYNFFKIKELGYLKRDELIEKWILIGDNELDDNEIYERKDYISQFLTKISKNKFIATYPLYVLILLQQLEAGKNSVSGNSYVEFYRFLINQSLNFLNIKPEEFEFYHSYLSFFAYKFFIASKKEFCKEELLEFHREFSKIYHKTDFKLETLLKAKIFKEDNNYYKFAHNYIYYFFVSKYLSDNLTKKRRKEKINFYVNQILNNLHLEEYANIIIFFIHHSHNANEFIIDKIISQGDSLFKEVDFFKMNNEELNIINQLIEKEAEIFIEDKNPDKYRKEILMRQDNVKNLKKLENQEMDKESLEIFTKMNLSFKIIEILAQVLKNYYASYEYDEKKEIIEKILKLGLKNLNCFFLQLADISKILQNDIEEKIDNKNLSEREILSIVKKIVFRFTELIIFIFTKKIADNLSNKNILDSLRQVINDKDILSFKIIDIEANLNFPNMLNMEEIENLYKKLGNNYIAKDIIRYLVIEHLYKFKIPFKQKQSICQKLNINFKYAQINNKE